MYLNNLQTLIGTWGEETFHHDQYGIMAHLLEEIEELDEAVGSPNAPGDVERIAVEAADCLILLLSLAHHMGFSLERAVHVKHQINKERKWGPPDERGVTHRIKDGDE